METNEMNGLDDREKEEDEKEAPLRRIVLPVDGSEQSFRAAKYAIKIAKKAGGKSAQIMCIYAVVRPSPFSPYSLGPTSVTAYMEDAKKNARQWYEEISAIAAKAGGVNVGGEIVIHDAESAADTIVSYAEANKVDLIVIGTEGKEGLAKKLLLGSVTSAVVSNATCPVLVVK